MSKDDKVSSSWKPINFGWQYWNYAIIGVALIVGFAIWVLPNQWADPEVQAGIERTKQRIEWAKEAEAQQKLLAEEEARIARENEENGLVYIDPGTNPFLPPPSQREGRQ
jgi:hypothetical protein